MDITPQMQNEARQAFKAQVLDKVGYISDKCIPDFIGGKLEEIDEVIEAGQRFNVTAATPFTDSEREKLTKELKDLRVLKMNGHAQWHLVKALSAKGVEPEIFVKS